MPLIFVLVYVICISSCLVGHVTQMQQSVSNSISWSDVTNLVENIDSGAVLQ